MTRPLIQIDDEVREMNTEEFKLHKLAVAEEQKRLEDAQAKHNTKGQQDEQLEKERDQGKKAEQEEKAPTNMDNEEQAEKGSDTKDEKLVP
jgi:hypothetical protein